MATGHFTYLRNPFLLPRDLLVSVEAVERFFPTLHLIDQSIQTYADTPHCRKSLEDRIARADRCGQSALDDFDPPSLLMARTYIAPVAWGGSVAAPAAFRAEPLYEMVVHDCHILETSVGLLGSNDALFRNYLVANAALRGVPAPAIPAGDCFALVVQTLEPLLDVPLTGA